MKKTIVVLLCLAFCLSTCIGFAEDLSLLSFADLAQLKQQVDYEYLSRPESTPMVLYPGEYTIGKDFPAGRYFFAQSNPSDDTCTISVRQDSSTYKNTFLEYLHLCEEPLSYSLEENNILRIDGGEVMISASTFYAMDYCNFVPPVGTRVPKGVYKVGVDLPAGDYLVTTGSIDVGYIYVYYAEDKYTESLDHYVKSDEFLSYYPHKTTKFDKLSLQDGYVLDVQSDVVMKRDKEEKVTLVFD